MRALGFIGASRLAAAERLLPEVIRQWREQWCFQGAAAHDCGCAAESAEVIALAAEQGWKQAGGAKGNLWLSAHWQQIVFGPYAADAPRDPVGQQLLEAAQQALAASLLAALGGQATAPLGAGVPAALGAALSPRLLLRARFGAEHLLLLVDAALLEAFLPATTRKHPPLLERRAAIGGAKLKLSVSLPFASLSVGEVNSLTPGDILQAGTHFLEPLDLNIQGKQTVAKGFLARRDEHLALQLTAHEQ